MSEDNADTKEIRQSPETPTEASKGFLKGWNLRMAGTLGTLAAGQAAVSAGLASQGNVESAIAAGFGAAMCTYAAVRWGKPQNS